MKTDVKSFIRAFSLSLSLSLSLMPSQAQAQVAQAQVAQAKVAQTGAKPAAKAAGKASAPKASPETAETKNNLNPEVLNAKAFLESLLIRRYSRELSTRVNEGSYSVGARITLAELAPEKKPQPQDQSVKEEPLPADLLLGSIDPEELLRRYEGESELLERAVTYLQSYRITAVEISAGIKSGFQTKAKEELGKWLTERVTNEFGAAGKATITDIQSPEVPKQDLATLPPWERLKEYQGLAGQLALAVAILLGLVLFALLHKRSGAQKTGEMNLNASGSLQSQVEKKGGATAALTPQEAEQRTKEDLRAQDEIREVTAKIQELMPRVTRDRLERVVRSWCSQGSDEGKLKLACFADSVGKATAQGIEQLPIPTDFIPALAEAFTTMPEKRAQERADALRKAYWDLLSAIHLGTEAFEKPFDYLVSQNVSMVEQVLIEQNPRMKTIVTLFMPKRLREDYVRTLGQQDKEALLLSAAAMSEIEATELKDYEGQLKNRLKPVGKKDVVPLEMALGKVVSALTPMEEIQLLSRISKEKSSPAIESYKRSTPSLAFLMEWNDESLSRLLARCMPDELTAYLRTLPDASSRMIGLAPPMTAEVVADELKRPDTQKEAEKNEILLQFQKRLSSMIESREIDLSSIFPEAEKRDDSRKGGLRAVA